jgi:general secretion pathway protein A
MYEQFYGLDERPFDLTPNPRFLFMTSSHRDALATMEYAIAARKGLTVVLGPPGTGKTTLVHAALDRHKGGNARAVYLGNPTLNREEFFEFIAQELGLSTHAASSKAAFLRELRADLVKQHALGTITALIIDEAQAMSDGLLEELRLLENLETPNEKLLPVVLVGQPEFAMRLRQPALLPLRQRVALRSTLAPLSRTEVAVYIAERIRIAGGDATQVFTPEAVAVICDATGGIPRNISVVCDNALVNGYALDQRPVGPAVIVEVCRDFDLPIGRPAPGHSRGAAAGVVLPVPAAVPEGTVAVRTPLASQMTNLQMPETPPPVETLMMDAPRRTTTFHQKEEPAPKPSTFSAIRSLFVRTAPR